MSVSKSSFLRIQRRMARRDVERKLVKQLGAQVPKSVIREMAVTKVRERIAAENAIVRSKTDGSR